MLKLNLQYFGHLMQKADSLEKTLMLGKIEGRRGDNKEWNGRMASLTQWTWVGVDSRSWWWTGRPGMLQSMGFHLVKAMVFPVVMYGCESWTIKKAEHPRIDAFELWCWRRLLRVPWTARRSTQSILKEISAGCSLEGLILKLKLQSFGHLMQKADSLEKTLMLGKIEGRRRRGRQRMRWLDSITNSMDGFRWTPGVGNGQGGLACCGSWSRKQSNRTEQLNWTDL